MSCVLHFTTTSDKVLKLIDRNEVVQYRETALILMKGACYFRLFESVLTPPKQCQETDE